MTTTEKRHWYNGHTKHGGWFHQYAFSIRSYGAIISWGTLPNGYRKDKLKIKFYKLI